MNRLFLEIALGAALAVCMALLGYTYRDSKAQASIATARTDTQTCVDASNGKQLALDRVADDLSKLRQQHKTAVEKANAAILEQLTANLQLRDDAIASTNFIRETADADPDCADLVRKPVCAAIADRLWPAALAPAGSQQPGAH